MSKLLILLLFMLISYAACDVKISNPDKSTRLANTQSYILGCSVTAPDVFDRWSNPLFTSSIQSDPNFEHTNTGNQHDLKIVSMNVFIAGVWTCSSKQGNSDNITLKFSPSVVTPAAKQQTLIKDQPGAIYIDIRGYPPPDFVWKKNKTVLNVTGRYIVTSNGTLLISKVETGDDGTYAASATKDFFNAESGDIVVKLLVAPSINGTSIRESRTSGGNISFECSASGVPTPSITWKKGSDVIANGGRFTISASGLLIMDIEPNDAGDYTCVAVNSAGTKELTSSLLSVHVPPVIAPLSPNEVVEKGKSLSVNCIATGSPAPTVEWSKNGIVLSTSQQMKSPGKSVLTLTNIQTDQGGVYECSAMNDAVDSMGNVIKPSQSIQVNVVYPPEFQNVTETIYVRLNQPATILCNAIGIPIPEMKLSYGSKDLQADTTKNSTPSSLTYRINKTSSDDLGVYTCTASSTLNTIQKQITLSVPLDKPEINNVKPTCNGVSFSWNHDTQNYIEVNSYQVTVTRSADQGLVKTKLVSNNTSQASFTGLEEKTEYELAVKQKTDVVNIGYESSKKTTTDRCPLKNINNVSTTGDTVTVYWPEAAKSVDKYIIKYRIKGSIDWMKKETEEIFIEISGLDYGEMYEFQVLYEDAGKEMAYTEVREVSIPPTATTKPAPTRKTTPPKTKEEPTGTVESTTTKRATKPAPTRETAHPPGKVARNKGLSGGAIAAIVIVIILLVLIAVDIFCCFFNQCGVVHMCAAACAGKKREKYNVDGSPEEGTKLKEVGEDGKEDPEA